MTTKAELEAVRFVLDKEWPDGTTSDSVARAAIKALDDLRKTAQRPLEGPLKPVLAFKPYWSSKTHYVRWIGEQRGKQLAWIVTADSDVGIITHVTSSIWQYSTAVAPAKATTRTVKTIDEDGVEHSEKKTYPPITEKLFVNDLGVVPGDKLSIKNVGNFTVEEVFSRGVLLRFQDGIIWGESNHDLQRYYKDGWI